MLGSRRRDLSVHLHNCCPCSNLKGRTRNRSNYLHACQHDTSSSDDVFPTYRADQGQELTSHKHPATAKHITETTCDGESNGGGDRPTTRDPYDVLRIAQLLPDLLQDAGGEKQTSADGGYVRQAHKLSSSQSESVVGQGYLVLGELTDKDRQYRRQRDSRLRSVRPRLNLLPGPLIAVRAGTLRFPLVVNMGTCWALAIVGLPPDLVHLHVGCAWYSRPFDDAVGRRDMRTMPDAPRQDG